MSNTFRQKYRDLTAEEKNLLDAVKTKAEELEALYLAAVQGRHTALAKTALEESIMWFVKGVTA